LKKIKFIGKLLFFSNIVLAIATLLAYVSPSVSPNLFWPVAFFGLALPYLLLLNFIFLLYWVFRGKTRLFLSLTVLILGYKSIPNFVQLRFDSDNTTEEYFKVLSFNVRVFDLYMWSKDRSTRNKIFDFLAEEDPDILCLQEFYHTDSPDSNYIFTTLDTLKEFLSAKNYNVYYTSTLRDVDHWGLITFSKYPIIGKGFVPFAVKDDNACFYTDVQIEDQTIRIYNTHLASIKLNKHDYKAMQEINKNEYSVDLNKEAMLLNKIKYGFIRRASQADSIKKSMKASPHPVILCGDFNDTPASYAYNTIKGDLMDAFVESGSGLGRTYIGEFPSFRIDYIFHDKSIQASNFFTHPEKLSDHHPISAKFKIEKN